jgi:hypothetical protein
MSIRNLPGGKGRPARKADNLTAICGPICLENVGASASHNPMGLYGLLQGQLYLFFTQRTTSLHVLGDLRYVTMSPKFTTRCKPPTCHRLSERQNSSAVDLNSVSRMLTFVATSVNCFSCIYKYFWLI